MSEDIVTRLRGQMTREFVIQHPHMVRVPTLHEQAADEIERLRELADNLYKTLQYYSCLCGISPCKCGYDDMMDEYKAVRDESVQR